MFELVLPPVIKTPTVMPAPGIVQPDYHWLTRMGELHDRKKYARLQTWQKTAIMAERNRIGPLIDGPIRVGQTRGTATQRAELNEVAGWVGFRQHELLPIMPVVFEKPKDLPENHPPLKWPSVMLGMSSLYFGQVAGSTPPTEISCDPWSIYFNGANDLTSTGHLGSGDGDSIKLAASIWMRFEDGGNRGLYSNGGQRLRCERRSRNNKLAIQLRTDAPAVSYEWQSAGNYDQADGWIHWMWSLRFGASADVHMINGTRDTTAASTYIIGSNAGLRAYNIFCGSQEGRWFMLGDIGELWFYEDWVDPRTRVGSFLSDGLPVDLGARGLNTGYHPHQYYSGDIDEFIDNKGREGSQCDLAVPGGGAVVTTTSACMNVGD